jgi:hypothetical protein
MIKPNRFKTYLFILFSIISGVSIAQDEEEDYDDATYTRIKPKHSLTIELGMPIAFQNKGFKGFMQGIVNFSPYYHYNFANNFAIGAGVNYNFFWINHVLSPDKTNVGGIHALGAFLELGHEKFYTDRLGTDVGIKLGYTNLNYYSANNRALGLGTPNQGVTFVEPTFSLVISADEFTSYRWIVGYVIQNYKFNPSSLGFTDQTEYHEVDYQKLTQFLTFGFGFSYYFKQR